MQRLLITLLVAWCLAVPLGVGAATQTFTTSGTWVAPAGVTSVVVEAWGAGGAGGGATGNPSQGGGGAGGQYAKKVQAVTPGNSYAIVVGTGGVGSTAAGAAGGDSSFGGTMAVAKGGAGGGLAAGNNTVGAGGVGSNTGGVGDTVHAGGSGAAGVAASTGGAGGGGAGSGGAGGDASGSIAGAGASVGGGAGAAGRTSSGSCNNTATAAGGGGCGGYAGGNTDRSGGNGAAGMVMLSYPSLTKTASSGAGRVGDVITFAIVYSNPLPTDIVNATVTDVLPAGMTYSTAAPTVGTVVVSGQTVTWSIPIIPAGGSAQLTLAVNLVNQGVITNTVTTPGASAGSASVLVLAGAVTHYKMDETVGSWSGATGEILDTGTTSLHGKRVLTGASTTTNVMAPSPTIAAQNASVVGGFCNAGRFDGNAVVEVPASTLFGYTDKLSASAWIYLTAYPSNGLYSVLSNDVNYEFHIDSNGKLYWWWNYSTLTSSTSIPLNQWTHVAITFSSASGAGRQRIYINGVQDTTTNNWTGSLQQNSCKFYIGGDIATGSGCALIPERNFKGNIDEVKLYNYELSASEVQADMTLGRNCSGTYDHIRIEHDGTGSVCTPETVTVKACLNSSCTSLYTGSVTVQLTPAGWTGGDTFTFSGGVTTRSLGVGTPGTVTLGVGSASPLAANSAKCYNGSTQTCSMTFSSASCNFDAVEVGANPKTRLFTKLAGSAFNVDILALTGSNVNTAVNSAVDVDLVDSSSTDCPSGAGLTTTQSVTLVNGRKTASFTYAQARPNVRVRMKQGSSAAACSTDNFAIRPDSITLVTSANATPPSAASTPAVRAGAAFTLYGTTTTGYPSSSVALDASKLTAQTTTQDATQASGGVVGTLGLASLPVNAATAPSNNATYSEAGYLYLAAGAYRDANFTSVDQPSGCAATGTCDCMTDTTSDKNLSTVLVGGKFGCHIGNTAASLGRFIPDHFDTTVTQGCVAGAYTYSAQPFTVTATARNAAGGTTSNYRGAFAKAVALSNAGNAANMAGNAIAANDFANGVGSANAVTFTFANPLTVPADLTLRALDTDAVSSNGFTEGTTNIRSGRVRLLNAYGSERLDLPMTMRAEIWAVGGGWQTHAADSCTATNLAFSAIAGVDDIRASTCVRDSGSPGASGMGCAAAGAAARQFREAGVAGFAGDFNLWLQAPQAAGAFNVTATVPAWLQFNWTGAVGNPTARATFGVYRSPLIYRRENY